GEGKGGAAGFAKGGAVVTLSPTDAGGTLLAYDVEAKVGGKLAQLGSRLIDGFAKKMADQFFTNFVTQLEGPSEPAEDDAPEAEKKGWLGKITGRS
ncbi:MAG: SRPBCC domain-containing protein, partial [Pseudomonadota bacterium]|nr:SRPBCC domain-containing protein [Pseudomonadota bacterium]